MINPMKYLDEGLVYLANKTVKLYNWTTGGTKSNLANIFLLAAPVVEFPAYLNNDPIKFAAYGLSAVSIIEAIKNKKLDKEESEASEKECMSAEVQDTKDTYYWKRCFVYGINIGTMIAASAVSPASAVGKLGFTEADGFALGSIGFALRTASNYIMRAGYLPPRKNVFSRVGKRLVDIIRNLKPITIPDIFPSPNPSPVPVPVPVNGGYS